MADQDSIVIFGAGRIGRSFIGQIFGLSGYKVVFVDIDLDLVDALNRRKSYPVVIRGDTEEVIMVPNVRAVYSMNRDQVVEEVAEASLLAVSVGKNALLQIMPLIARGIKLRYQRTPDLPLDIIIAENMRDAARQMQEWLTALLADDYPVNRLLGFVETSIGKMVPIIPDAEINKDPLKVFAEPYNELIVDAAAFKSTISNVKGLAPKSNIRAWVDRKAFIHNMGHATAAYKGYFLHPQAKYVYEVLQDENIFRYTSDVMLQASEILLSRYPEDFTKKDLEDHIDDLLKRFQNRALGDTLYRVGRDLSRKLGKDDRFMGIIHMAIQIGMNYDKILNAMVHAFFFRGKDDYGNMYTEDIRFVQNLSRNLNDTIVSICGLHQVEHAKIIEDCKRIYRDLNKQLT